MARFLNDYRELDTRPVWEKVAMTATWIALILLIPGTTLGYFAEKSYPGQALYPMKRGIEQMVLLVESITPYSRSTYLQTLASNRIQETSDLVAYGASDTSIWGNESLDNVVFSVEEAQVAISQIKDPVAKQKATEQLSNSIHTYQQQLHQIDYTIQKNLLPTPTPTPTIVTQQSNTNTNVSESSSPTPTPAPSNNLSNLDNQIQNVVQQLSNIDSTLSGGLLPPPPPPTAIPTPTHVPMSTPTPLPRRHGDGNRNG